MATVQHNFAGSRFDVYVSGQPVGYVLYQTENERMCFLLTRLCHDHSSRVVANTWILCPKTRCTGLSSSRVVSTSSGATFRLTHSDGGRCPGSFCCSRGEEHGGGGAQLRDGHLVLCRSGPQPEPDSRPLVISIVKVCNADRLLWTIVIGSGSSVILLKVTYARLSNASVARNQKILLAAGAAVLVSGCAGSPAGGNDSASPHSHSGSGAGSYPTVHIHGMTVNTETEDVLLATHDGLFNVTGHHAEKIGPTLHLMGFSAAAPGKFYASGHPGQGSDMPNPVGLIKSTDGGKSWTTLSREGESDFHALTTSDGRIVAFDGTLRTSEDGETWQASPANIQPFHLAGTPRSEVVLATTEKGLQRSTDAGSSWTGVPDVPLLMFTAWANAETAVGVTPDGQVHVSREAGLSWTNTGSIQTGPAAIAATADGAGDLKIWVATPEDVQFSGDSGETFAATDTGE